MTTLLDTNILVAVLNENDPHNKWCVEQLQVQKTKGPALICDIVYCEFSVGMPSQAAVAAAVAGLALERIGRTSDEALFLAGKAYKKYRGQGGPKSNVLPDFLIGAVAEVNDIPLLTTNPNDYKNYFPNVQMIFP